MLCRIDELLLFKLATDSTAFSLMHFSLDVEQLLLESRLTTLGG